MDPCYISVLESHTSSVLPRHTVIDEQIPCLSADETITEGKRPSARSLSDSQSRRRRPTKTAREAPEFQSGRCCCRVKLFPRYETTEEGRLDEATHTQTTCWFHCMSRSFRKKQHSIPGIMRGTFATQHIRRNTIQPQQPNNLICIPGLVKSG